MATALRRPLWLRLFYLIPIIGWTARDVAEKGDDNLIWGVASIIFIWAGSALMFGYPGIIIPALLLVPFIFLFLIAISWSR